MNTFCIHNARKMRTNFSLVYISPCTYKCLIKITRQSSNSCDAGSHRCADETTARLNCPETRWRTPCRSVGRTSTSLHDATSATPTRRPPLPPPPRVTFLSLHSWDQRKPTFRYIIVCRLRRLRRRVGSTCLAGWRRHVLLWVLLMSG